MICGFALVLSGCATSPDFSERLANSLQILQQQNNEMIARNATLNNRQVVSPGYQLMSNTTSGGMRYCRYSNGAVNTMVSSGFCPLSISP